MKFDFTTFNIAVGFIEIVILSLFAAYLIRLKKVINSLFNFSLFLLLNAFAVIGLALLAGGIHIFPYFIYIILIFWAWFFLSLSVITLFGKWKISNILIFKIHLVVTICATIVYLFIYDIKGTDKIISSSLAISFIITSISYYLKTCKHLNLPKYFIWFFLFFALATGMRLIYHICIFFKYELFYFHFVDYIYSFIFLMFVLLASFSYFLISKELTVRKLSTQIILNKFLMEKMPLSVLITDKFNKIQYVNPSFCERTGYASDEVINKTPSVLKSEFTKPEVYEDLKKALHEGIIWFGHFINKNKNGELIYDETIISQLRDEFNNLSGYIAIKNDITERIKNERTIQEQNAELLKLNTKKNKLFHTISHDLRNPLGHILSLCEVYEDLRNGKNFVEAEKTLTYLKSSAESTFRILENLLYWGRLEMNSLNNQQKEIVNIASAVDSVIESFRYSLEEKHITININIDKNFAIQVNCEMFVVILKNILSNAVKFSFSHGKIQIYALETDEMIHMTIEDAGRGITSDMLSRIFEVDSDFSMKETLGDKGPGLGLPLSYELVKMNQGKIEISSTQNSGTKVHLFFNKD